MTDIVSKEKRGRMMAGIGVRDTSLELFLRRGLHRRGFRYRVNDPRLPGRPDMVFPKYQAVIMANGCFWHGHDCSLFKEPATRREWWRKKLQANRDRDIRKKAELESAGWRVLDVWECAVRGPDRRSEQKVLNLVAEWLRDGSGSKQIRGASPST